jgi:hypothetical protein
MLCSSDEIIRGKESDVASYMIHVILSTVVALLYDPWHCCIAATNARLKSNRRIAVMSWKL